MASTMTHDEAVAALREAQPEIQIFPMDGDGLFHRDKMNLELNPEED